MYYNLRYIFEDPTHQPTYFIDLNLCISSSYGFVYERNFRFDV